MKIYFECPDCKSKKMILEAQSKNGVCKGKTFLENIKPEELDRDLKMTYGHDYQFLSLLCYDCKRRKVSK